MEESQEGKIAHTLALIIVVIILLLVAKGVASLAGDPPSWEFQAGAVVVAVALPVGTAGDKEKGDIVDYPPPAQAICPVNFARSGDIPIVNSACYQEADIREIKHLEQTCAPGFKFNVTITRGVVKVTPSSLQSTHPICKPPTAPTCKTGNKPAIQSFSTDKCQVKYCVGDVCALVEEGPPSGKLLDPNNLAQGIAEAYSGIKDDVEMEAFKNELSAVPTEFQSSLDQAFGEQRGVAQKQIERNNTAIDQLKAKIDLCTPDCPAAVLPAELKRQQEELEKQNEELRNRMNNLANAKKVLAPQPQTQPQTQPQPQPQPQIKPSTFPQNSPTANPGASNQNGFDQMLQGLMQKLSGGQPSAGNQAAQPEGTCPTQVICSGNTLYSRNNQCVDTTIQYCQYGCLNKTACATVSQQPTPPTQPGQPTAQLSCQPLVADVGMTLAISWGCSVGKSVGSGFSTNEAISGSATTTLAAPPTATRTVNFGLTCINKGISSNASCTVQVAKPAIVLVANPKSVESGERASIGWVTASMKENGCVISSSNQPDFTAQNANNPRNSGVAETLPITTETTFLLTCMTAGGNTREATTTVMVK